MLPPLSGLFQPLLVPLKTQKVTATFSGRKHIGERLALLVRANYVARARSLAARPGVHWLTPKAATHFHPVFGEEWARAASGKGFTDNLHMPQRLLDYAMGRQKGSAATRMMFVFGSAAMLERAMTTLPDRDARVWRAVFFKSLPDLVEDFGGTWLQATGERRNPFERVEPAQATGAP